MDILRTRHGLRLSQHGVVVSELRTTPGPTHSVFDVLAALMLRLDPGGRVGLLGFAGGGLVAPLRALGSHSPFAAVDLDRTSYELFRTHCPDWNAQVDWHQDDAGEWLARQPANFSLLVEDLSEPHEGDVFKPAMCWRELPELIRTRLRPDGIGVFNLLRPRDSWEPGFAFVAGHFEEARVVHLDEFENRILVVGRRLPSAREMGTALRAALRRLRSRQADRLRVLALSSATRAGGHSGLVGGISGA